MAGVGRGKIMQRVQEILDTQNADPSVGSSARAEEIATEEPEQTEAANDSKKDAILESWNPMEEDFRDPEFNSYDKGPGKDLPLDTQRRRDTGEKRPRNPHLQLYVRGIPLDMKEKGIVNLFSRAGDVVHVRKMESKQPNNKNTYGFVTFRTLAEVEAAISMLDGFNVGGSVLHVRPARSREEKAMRAKKQENIRMVDDDGDDGEERVIDEDEIDDVPTSDVSVPPENASPKETEERASSVPAPNPKVTPTTQVSPDAKPKPVKKCSRQPGPCQHCGKHAKKYCQRCHRPYCGADCQKADWPRHKITCQKPTSSFEERFEVDYDIVDEMIKNIIPATPVTPEGEEYRTIPYSEVKKEQLLTNDLTEVLITYTESPSRMWVTKAQNEPLKGMIQKKLEQLTKINADFKPAVGIFCAAKYAGDWYRAVVKESNQARTEASVTYVDYGNSENVKFNMLAELHKDLVTIPAQAILCDLSIKPPAGVDNWRTPDVETFVKLIHSQEILKVNVEGYADGVTYATFYLCDGRHIANLMVLNENAQFEEKPSTFKPNPTKPVIKEVTIPGKRQTPSTPSTPKSSSSGRQEKDESRAKGPSPDQVNFNASKVSNSHPGESKSPTYVARQNMLARPKDQLLPTLIESIKSPLIGFGEQFEVKLCRVDSIDRFWVQVLNEEFENDYKEMHRKLNEHYQKKEKCAVFRPPKSGVVAAFDSDIGEWERALILDFDLKGVLVYFFDLGLTRHLDLTDVHPLDSPFGSVPVNAFCSELCDIIPKGGRWSPAAVDRFVDYVKDTGVGLLARVMDITHDSYVIDLFNLSEVASLRDTLIEEGFATPASAEHLQGIAPSPPRNHPAESIVMASDIPRCELPVSSTLHDVILRSSSSHNDILICETQGVEEFDTFLDKIDSLLSQYRASYKPVMVSELVFVKDAEGHWWRSEVLAINMDKSAQVRSLDINKISTAKREQMACVPSDLQQVKVIAMQCTLHGIQGLADGVSWQDDIVPHLQGKTLKAQVRAKNGPVHAVELYTQVEGDLRNLNKWLVKEGLVFDVKYEPALPKSTTTSPKLPQPVRLTMPSMKNLTPPKPTMISLPNMQATPPKAPVHYADHMQCFMEEEPVVIVWEATDPGQFYAQPKSHADRFSQFEDAFRKDYPRKNRKQITPNCGDIVAALNPEDNKWYRAQVIDTHFKNTSRILVRFVDYGIKDLVDLDCIHLIDEKHLMFDFQGIRCQLHGWDGDKHDSDTLAQLFSTNLLGQVVKLKLGGKEDGSYVVRDILNTENSESLFCETGPLSGFGLKREQLDDDGEEIAAPRQDVPEQFTGVIGSFINLGDFSLQFDEEKVLELADDVDVYCQKTPFDPEYNPDVETLCCSQFCGAEDKQSTLVDGMWYRAKILAKTSELFTVVFVDYGNRQTVAAPFLRPLTEELAATPPQAIRCSLSGLAQPGSAYSDEVAAKFNALTDQVQLDVTVDKVIDSVHWVKMQHPTMGDLSDAVDNGM